MKSLVFVLFFGLVSAGCMVALTKQGANVKVGKMIPHSNCQELGIVYGTGTSGAVADSELKMRNAQNDLRNKTSDLGGNFVVMDASGADTSGVTLSGRAFKCGEAPPPGTAPAPQPQASLEKRLTKLKDLLDKGIITQEEHDKRRQEILQSI